MIIKIKIKKDIIREEISNSHKINPKLKRGRERVTGTWRTGSWKDWHNIISDPAKTKCNNVSSCLLINCTPSPCRYVEFKKKKKKN